MNASYTKLGSPLRYLQLVFFAAAILYFGRMLFIPLFFGLLIAMVMFPVCRWLEQKGWSRLMTTTFSLFVVTVLFALLLTLLIWQLSVFRHELPEITRKMDLFLADVQLWINGQLGVAVSGTDWLRNLSPQGNMLGNILLGTFRSTADMLFMLFMIPVFTALFLYQRHVFIRYLKVVVGPRYQAYLDAILAEVIGTYSRYIRGMIMVYLIVGTLNSIGLLALGIRHAILFGMLAAIMTIIPYIGIIVSALLPVSVAWITKGSVWYPLGVIGVFSFVQYLEANVIFPKVVGAQLNVSTWATLVAILAGGILWGVSGMILFIPFVAILKIVAGHVDEWKALNLLLSRLPPANTDFSKQHYEKDLTAF